MYNDKTIKIEIENYILFDKLSNLSVQYNTSIDCLVNIVIQRLIDDVEFIRELRNINSIHNTTDVANRPDEKK